MKLNELLEREGFTSVKEKTNISIENLIKLVDNDLESLSRVKALGFVSILKREYEIELEELESNIKDFFEENILEDDTQVIVAAERKEDEKGIFKWIIIAALLGGLWYLYSSGQLGGNLSNESTKENGLKDSEVLQNSIMKNGVAVEEEGNKTKLKDKIAKNTPLMEDNHSQKATEAESNKIEKDIKENKEKREKEAEKKKAEREAKKREAEKKKREKAEIDAVETILNETTKEINQAKENSIETSSETIISEDEKAEIIYNVTVNPRVNLWFGFINLNTKARKEFITTKSTAIDVGEQRWVLITGHGRLSVASELSTLKINDSSKHYFYIDSSEIREINRSEFKALNDGRGW